jgi:hypothetical protein
MLSAVVYLILLFLVQSGNSRKDFLTAVFITRKLTRPLRSPMNGALPTLFTLLSLVIVSTISTMGALMSSRNLEPCWAAPQGKALQHEDGQLYFVEVERDADKNLEQRQAKVEISTRPVLGGRL